MTWELEQGPRGLVVTAGEATGEELKGLLTPLLTHPGTVILDLSPWEDLRPGEVQLIWLWGRERGRRDATSLVLRSTQRALLPWTGLDWSQNFEVVSHE